MKKTVLFSTLLFAFSACEEVIKLELDTSEQRVIAEANLDATHGTCSVSLSKSDDFYESNVFEKIPGASVSLTSPTGVIIALADNGNGTYFIDNMAVVPGETFDLKINLPDGKVVEATDVLVPVAVVLDSLLVEKTEFGPGNPPGGGSTTERFSLTAQWRDPVGEANFYRLKIFENGEFQSGTYILADDRLGDGANISRPIIRQTYETGDTLRVQLLSVSKGYHDYFTDLANSEGRMLSAPVPFNPKGNLTGDVLGYFGIWQVSEKTIIVK